MNTVKLFIGRQANDYDDSGFPIGDNDDYSMCGYSKPTKIVEYYECNDCNTLFILTSSKGHGGDGDYDDSQGLNYNCKNCNISIKRTGIKYDNEKIIYENDINKNHDIDNISINSDNDSLNSEEIQKLVDTILILI